MITCRIFLLYCVTAFLASAFLVCLHRFYINTIEQRLGLAWLFEMCMCVCWWLGVCSQFSLSILYVFVI